MDSRDHIHGTALALDGVGILIVGPSGSGKSLLALSLIDRFLTSSNPTGLVSDDLVIATAGGPHKNDQVILSAPNDNSTQTGLHGQIELRGFGLVKRPFIPQIGLDLLVGFVSQTERMPEQPLQVCQFVGHSVARIDVMPHPDMSVEQQILIVSEALKLLEKS